MEEGSMEDSANWTEIALRERIKELNCLYGMARLAERFHGSMEDFLKGLVDFLPQSWRYPEIACAQIVFQGTTFASERVKDTPWRQSAPIRISGEPVGEVAVLYLEERPEADEGPFLQEERALLEGVAQRIGDMAVRIMARQALQESNRQLLAERKALQEANAALRAVLSNIDEEKRRIYETMRQNIEQVVMPLLHTLAAALPQDKRSYLEILKAGIEEIASPFTDRVLDVYRPLTPAEVHICNLIRNGLTTKEIAVLRGISPATVHRHRERIRRKLGLANQQVHLTTFLQSLPVPEGSRPSRGTP